MSPPLMDFNQRVIETEFYLLTYIIGDNQFKRFKNDKQGNYVRDQIN
jgi:hypothetical protein